jgi:hypothetical protein
MKRLLLPLLSAAGALFLAACSTVSPSAPADAGVSAARAPLPPIASRPAIADAWKDAIVLETPFAQAVVVPSLGRVVYFAGRDGENIYRCESSLVGQKPSPAADGDTFFNIGGDWLWPVAQAHWHAFPGRDGNWPPPKALRDAGWKASTTNGAITLTRNYGKPVNAKATRTFFLAPDAENGTAALVIDQTLTRTKESTIPLVLWHVSQIAAPDAVLLPLAAESALPGGFVQLDGPPPAEGRLSATDTEVIYRLAEDGEIKLGSDAGEGAGAVAAARGGGKVLVSAVVASAQGFPGNAAYPDGGCSHEAYVNCGLGYAEIETLSREVLLPPGETVSNRLVIRLDVP